MNQYRKQVLPNLSNRQFAYRAGVGTTDAIIYTTVHWNKMLDDRGIKAVEVLFKDFSKYRKQVLPNLSNIQFAYRAGVGTTDAIIYRFCSSTLAKLSILCSLPSF